MIDETKMVDHKAIGKLTLSIFFFFFLGLSSGNLGSCTKLFFHFKRKNPLATTFIPLSIIRNTEFQYSNCDVYRFFAVLLIEEPKMADHCWQNHWLALGC
ncbi:unnamed protein product [Meganyctiphanes norvegica]|uniref:Secreted protein n=1 Tax=Meganyctiphanes norvegica TaxID=48144 RepID=A0AAV2RWW6_MEGNR